MSIFLQQFLRVLIRPYSKGIRGVRQYTVINAESEALRYKERKDKIQVKSEHFFPSIQKIRFQNVLRIPKFRQKFNDHDFDQYEHKWVPEHVSLEGRIKSVRRSGKGMYFLDLVQDNSKVQVVASNKLMNISKEAFSELHGFLRKGDSVTCVGFPSRTKVGELSLKLTEPIRTAAPSLKSTMIPQKIISKSLINKNRVLHYLVNEESRQRLIIKSHIIQIMRNFFLARDFLEVQTPMLGGYGTGANAEPFKTTSSALDSDKSLQLRVAPELWLKKLIIGGFDKIFEIGQSFRNEGIDLTHNPEFSTCEFYQSFASLNELMEISEALLKDIYVALEQKTNNISLLQRQLPNLTEIRAGDFPRYEFIPILESRTGVPLPCELTSESLLDYYKVLGLDLPNIKSPQSLLDNLSSIYLESISKGNNTPIFIYNQPSLLSPLSKSAPIAYGARVYDVSLRFELFINGKEYMNSYEEENSPFLQANKFKLQQLSKSEFNDNDALIPDWEYVKLMEYGLPPTGGWGCGIDRLAMLFSGTQRIEDVLSFGNLRDVIRQ
ncbi:uncharacterized protein PRCAT00003351001 [Priceomyces carsonii]|uniref:uncharacterized protein n=1 Tax=Priceomyces carsonii TaxID=28549 RepID=UPI002ED9088A|nr:unnamed protein product [Priceomyces carsonii]